MIKYNNQGSITTKGLSVVKDKPFKPFIKQPRKLFEDDKTFLDKILNMMAWIIIVLFFGSFFYLIYFDISQVYRIFI